MNTFLGDGSGWVSKVDLEGPPVVFTTGVTYGLPHELPHDSAHIRAFKLVFYSWFTEMVMTIQVLRWAVHWSFGTIIAGWRFRGKPLEWTRKVTRFIMMFPMIFRPKRGGYSYEMLRIFFETHPSIPNYLCSSLNISQLDIRGSYVFIPSVT